MNEALGLFMGQDIPQFLTRSELNPFALLDFDLSFPADVPAIARLFINHPETAEASDLDFLVLGQGLFERFQDRLDDAQGFCPVEF